jgi:hypothetical protein
MALRSYVASTFGMISSFSRLRSSSVFETGTSWNGGQMGTAKELVESTAKTVLQERGYEVDDKDKLPALVRQAQEALGLQPVAAGPGPDGTDAVRRILGGLTNIAAGLGELRNRGYGPGTDRKVNASACGPGTHDWPSTLP